MKRLMTALLAAALSVGPMPSVVFAQSVTEQVEELSQRAATAYQDGDFDRAIELFQEAYELQPVPNLLFNIAKVQEKKENWKEAITFYKEFIKAPDADSQARQVALDRIDALEQIQRVEQEEREAEERRLAEEERKRQEAELAARKKDPVEEPEQATSGTGPVPWIVTGVGAGLLIGGGVFGLLASDAESVFKTGETAEERRDARSKGMTYALVADSMFIAGGVATVVGIILFATMGGSDQADERRAVIPTGWVGPGEGGVGVSLTF